MAFVPIIVQNRRNRGYRNSTSGGILAAVVLLFIFGLLFFVFFNSFDGPISPMFIMISSFSVFLIIIVVIGAVAASMSTTYKKPKEDYMKSYQDQNQMQTMPSSPYIVRNSIPKQPEEPIINYCRYCGSKIDRDQIYCHQCGTKL